MSRPDLFVGITAWNSATTLGACLDSVRETTRGVETRIVVLDNRSTDGTADIARRRAVELHVKASTQADALNRLFDLSDAPLTLLLHSDVVLLSKEWLSVCGRRLGRGVALVSPDDVGCGPFTRPWGKGKPESSFLLFDTALPARTRIVRRVQRFKVRWPARCLDLYGPHVTYSLPERLSEAGLSWTMMNVHVSPESPAPLYEPSREFENWKDVYGRLEYGLGNFYSLDGVVTHYHNWYERALNDGGEERDGLPLEFLRAYTRRFLEHHAQGRVRVPVIAAPREAGASA